MMRVLPVLLLASAVSRLGAQQPGSPEGLSVAERAALEELSGEHRTVYQLVDSWFESRPIQYYHFGPSDVQPGSLYRVRGGGEVVSSLPGLPGYSALRQVFDVELLPAADQSPVAIRSHEQILKLVRLGRARLVAAGAVLNLPIVPAGSALERDPAQRPLREASYKGQTVHYFDFGPNRPMAVPLVVFARRFPAGRNEPLEPVPGQASNASSVPGYPGYSDLWDIHVVVGSGSVPGGYRDFRRVGADIRSRKLAARLRGAILNCPVVYVDGRPAPRAGPVFAAQPPRPEQASLVSPAGNGGPAPAPSAPPAPATPGGVSRVFSGLNGQTSVRIPRLEADPVIDGTLSEPAWRSATVLTGFSQFQPVDGRPAADSTEVLVWYSPRAIYFGIRAFEAHGAVHATLADRDKIGSDDYVQLLLDTFNDHRRALVFGVNPLGVQSDGTLSEGIQAKSGGGGAISGPSNASVRDTADLSADFTYQSKGRLTDYGYEVEVRVPFKSIRYQALPEQNWGINVVRRVQHSGYEDSWTPARRANASFLGQSGTIVGLSGLERGLVLEVNPVVTSKLIGAPGTPGWTYDYDGSRPQPGGNLRWGVTSNLTLNGTVKPDFSQVEADVQQVNAQPRSALFYPEKRPFFLEGLEQFETPNQLIYTRRVVQPVAATKLTGKISGTSIGLLSAVDDRTLSASTVDNPIYNMVRLRRDLGRQSTLGVVYTDKIDGDNFNRVAGVDSRVVFSKIYAVSLQGAGSLTRSAGITRQGPLFSAILERTGRSLNLRYDFHGFHPDFQTGSGFIRQGNLVQASFSHRFTFYGKPGALIENWTLNVPLSSTWNDYRGFFNGGTGDLKNDNSVAVTLRGGWRLGALFFPESFKYDSNLFANYAIERHVGATVDTIRFTGTDRLQNWDVGLSVQTPQYARFNGFLSVLSGQDENFPEWSSAWVWYVTATADLRPSPKVRISARYQRQQFVRLTDWTTSFKRDIPRLKVEYQLARPIFLRVVGQYDIQWTDSLRDDSRTNFPLLIRNASGVYQRATIKRSNNLRVDWLFSYQPNPGTVLFAGYGSSLTETDPFTFRDLRRTSDGFFVKLSYLLRL